MPPLTQAQPSEGFSGTASLLPGDQPDTPVAWIAGDVLNAPELRRQLALDSDAPLQVVVRAAWQRWSTEAPSRLEGVFTLAVHDSRGLCLYRDPSGFRDLYVLKGEPGHVAFATDLNGLAQLPGVRARPARQALHEYLRFFDIAAPNAWYERVRAVEAGHLVHWSANGVEVRDTPGRRAATFSPTDFPQAVDLLDQHLQQSIRACLEGTDRPAAFLSGGVDSALLCAIAARHRPDLVTVTVGFDRAPFDESAIAQQIASHLRLEHQVLRYGHADYVAAFERLAKGMDQPMADPATPATLLSFEHCCPRFDAVLDGSGVEDAIGYDPPRHMRAAVGYAALLPPWARAGLTRLLARIPPLADYTPILDFEHPAETMIRWKGFKRLEIEELCREAVSLKQTQFYRTFARFPRRAHLQRYSAVMACLPGERLTQAQRLTGAAIRYPFCEPSTWRFLCQLPPEFRHVPGESKRILRAVLARYVPREIWDFPKHTFDFPLQTFLSNDDFALVRRHVLDGRWLERGLLDFRVVQRYAQQYMAGEQRLMFRVWALVVLGAWLDAHEWVD